MLNAAEAQIEATAKDDKERARLRSRIYAPPRAERGTARRRPTPTRMTKGDAKAFLAAAAAQETQATRGDS